MQLFALRAEIWLLSAQSVQDAAKHMCDLALSANASADDRAEGDQFAAKWGFVEAARTELAVLEADARKSRA